MSDLDVQQTVIMLKMQNIRKPFGLNVYPAQIEFIKHIFIILTCFLFALPISIRTMFLSFKIDHVKVRKVAR
jgi:hypothetical protein